MATESITGRIVKRGTPLADSSTYHLWLERSNGVVFLCLQGKAIDFRDMGVSERIGMALTGQSPALAVDLSGCGYISSTVMSMLFRIVDMKPATQAMIPVVGCQPRIRSMMEAIGLSEWLEFVQDRSIAITVARRTG